MKLYLIKKYFCLQIFIPPLSMVMHWNKFYEENEIFEIGQACHQGSQKIFN